jgi:glycosyltransferase involved in cell wall biosynthesis
VVQIKGHFEILTVSSRYSFIIPAYNEGALIGATIEAINSAAAGLEGGFEVVVANDSSTDRTGEIARGKGARVIDVRKRQIAAVRNAGASIATGDVLVFVDADTLVRKETLLEMQRILKDERVAGGGAKMVFDGPLPFWGKVTAGLFLFIYFRVPLAAGGFLFARRAAFEKAGRWDERFFAGEEIHLSRALKKLGKFRIAREPVITSARKFRMKSFRDHVALFKNMARKGKKGWEQREGLDMWYDGSRE